MEVKEGATLMQPPPQLKKVARLNNSLASEVASHRVSLPITPPHTLPPL